MTNPDNNSKNSHSSAFAEERSFLRGPRERWKEFRYTLGVVRQFLKGFRTLHFAGPCITFFGSARFHEDHQYYRLARELASGLSKIGCTIMTGGGPGIMEAANRGAKEAGGLSIGCNIILPKEQQANPYMDKFVSIDYFFVRKELLRKYSCAFVVMPGGYGTLDEFFETLTLIQTGKTDHFPVIIMGLEYHKDLIAHFEKMKSLETISNSDMEYILFTDSPIQARGHIEKYLNISPKFTKRMTRPIGWLGEKKLQTAKNKIL